MITPAASQSRSLTLRSDGRFNAVKVFAATTFEPRSRLGETVTDWIAANPGNTITEFVVTQSSDSEFHCVTICVFYLTR